MVFTPILIVQLLAQVVYCIWFKREPNIITNLKIDLSIMPICILFLCLLSLLEFPFYKLPDLFHLFYSFNSHLMVKFLYSGYLWDGSPIK